MGELLRLNEISRTAAPISVENLRVFVKQNPNTDGENLEIALAGAIDLAETYLNRYVLQVTMELTLDDWPSWDTIALLEPPVSSVVSIKYTDINGAEQTYANTNYTLDSSGFHARIVLKSGSAWPILGTGVARVRVRYVCGFASDALPAAVRSAILLLAEGLYERQKDNEDAAYRLLSSHRMFIA